MADNVIYAMMSILAAALVLSLFSGRAKALLRFILRGAAGAAGIFIVDVLFSPIGLSVGINFFTAGVTAVLGIPGFVLLYVLACIWR